MTRNEAFWQGQEHFACSHGPSQKIQDDPTLMSAWERGQDHGAQQWIAAQNATRSGVIAALEEIAPGDKLPR